jgi:hypothetical protein
MVDFNEIFSELYFSATENDVDEIIIKHSFLDSHTNWFPLDNNESNFGVIENQQSSPIAALIEKITNSIDAILMRKCFEAGINPSSTEAPKGMEGAIAKFFDSHCDNWHKNWNLPSLRQKQAEEIQIIADGPSTTYILKFRI